jgi:hypothetical protein
MSAGHGHGRQWDQQEAKREGQRRERGQEILCMNSHRVSDPFEDSLILVISVCSEPFMAVFHPFRGVRRTKHKLLQRDSLV